MQKQTKAKNYLQNRLVSNIFLRIISFDVLYLTNSFITNIHEFNSSHMINLKELLNEIKDNYSLIVIPDFLFNNIGVESLGKYISSSFFAIPIRLILLSIFKSFKTL